MRSGVRQSLPARKVILLSAAVAGVGGRGARPGLVLLGTVAGVRATLEQWALVLSFLQWLDSVGAGAFAAVLAPLIVVALAVPVIVVNSPAAGRLADDPALVGLVATRRFPSLERRQGGGLVQRHTVVAGYMLVALLLLGVSLPLWFIPPLVLVLPPLIWGWLTTR